MNLFTGIHSQFLGNGEWLHTLEILTTKEPGVRGQSIDAEITDSMTPSSNLKEKKITTKIYG